MGFPAVTVVLIAVLLVIAEPRRDIKYKVKKQDFLHRFHEENETRIEENAYDVCHKVALRRCGQNFMRAFNLVEYLSGADYYNTHCTLRKAFFACLDKLRQKPCRKRRASGLDDKRFRKKLADALWETRVCVLGIKDIEELPPKKKGLK
ncbi:hypothetical protein MRX96_007152 [Rhipicephalus microplus]|nr:uncharacterized protein LOC119176249 isoform X2 [Rhipicephalus microplus]